MEHAKYDCQDFLICKFYQKVRIMDFCPLQGTDGAIRGRKGGLSEIVGAALVAALSGVTDH
jgi:hypothetical protein